MSEAICTTCNKTHPWPDGTTPRHPFNDGSLPMSATFGQRRGDGPRGSSAPTMQSPTNVTPDMSPWPFDPVLRTALIMKGVLTLQDLSMAEQHMRAVAGVVGTGVGLQFTPGGMQVMAPGKEEGNGESST